MRDFRDDSAQAFWNRIEKVTAGMLRVSGETHLPMSHFADPDEGVFWFITSEGSAAHQAAIEGRDSHYIIADRNARVYADIKGTLREVKTRGKLDELWTRAAEAWFEEGRDDPDVRLLCLTPDKAEAWLTEGGAKFIYEIARAGAKSTTPDLGEHAVITF